MIDGKKMGRQDARQKRNGETRGKTIKRGDKIQDKKKLGDEM